MKTSNQPLPLRFHDMRKKSYTRKKTRNW